MVQAQSSAIQVVPGRAGLAGDSDFKEESGKRTWLGWASRACVTDYNRDDCFLVLEVAPFASVGRCQRVGTIRDANGPGWFTFSHSHIETSPSNELPGCFLEGGIVLPET